MQLLSAKATLLLMVLIYSVNSFGMSSNGFLQNDYTRNLVDTCADPNYIDPFTLSVGTLKNDLARDIAIDEQNSKFFMLYQSVFDGAAKTPVIVLTALNMQKEHLWNRYIGSDTGSDDDGVQVSVST